MGYYPPRPTIPPSPPVQDNFLIILIIIIFLFSGRRTPFGGFFGATEEK